jgi:hypothetical protein
LEEDCVLGVDEGVGNLEVEVGFRAGVCHGRRCDGAINCLKLRACSLGNVSWGKISSRDLGRFEEAYWANAAKKRFKSV